MYSKIAVIPFYIVLKLYVDMLLVHNNFILLRRLKLITLA